MAKAKPTKHTSAELAAKAKAVRGAAAWAPAPPAGCVGVGSTPPHLAVPLLLSTPTHRPHPPALPCRPRRTWGEERTGW